MNPNLKYIHDLLNARQNELRRRLHILSLAEKGLVIFSAGDTRENMETDLGKVNEALQYTRTLCE